MKRSEWTEDSLYMVFQMLSGDELHVVSKEVMIEKYYHELYLNAPCCLTGIDGKTDFSICDTSLYICNENRWRILDEVGGGMVYYSD